MKKIFASLAATAMALTMCAFVGCGDSEDKKDDNNKDNNVGTINPDGSIPGNYEDVKEEDLAQIIAGIKPEKLFANGVNLGLLVDLSGSIDTGIYGSASGSLKAEYKLAAGVAGIAGHGTASLKADYNIIEDGETLKDSINVKGEVWHDMEYVYAIADGKAPFMEQDEYKAKIDIMQVINAMNGEGSEQFAMPYSSAPNEEGSFTITSGPSLEDIAEMLEMAHKYGVTVKADTSNGVALKISASVNTVWAIVENMIDGELTSSQFTEIKKAVTVNKFQLDLYLSIDKNGAFHASSVVVDVDVKVDVAKINAVIGGETEDVPLVTLKLKGSVKVSTHNEKISIPSSVKNDTYYDATQDVIDMIEGEMNEGWGNNDSTGNENWGNNEAGNGQNGNEDNLPEQDKDIPNNKD